MIEILVPIISGLFLLAATLIANRKESPSAPFPRAPGGRAGRLMGIFAFGAIVGLLITLPFTAPLRIPTITPIGTIVAYHGQRIPDGWLLCDGSLISAAHNGLIDLVGSNTPDLQGFFLRGLDPAGKRDPDGKNRKLGSTQEGLVGEHHHSYNMGGRGGKSGGSSPDTLVNDGPNPTSDQGHGIGAETRPKNVAVHFIIKY
jgi:Phage Tail Collar Domain